MQWISGHPISFNNMIQLKNDIPYENTARMFDDKDYVNKNDDLGTQLKAAYNLPTTSAFHKEIDLYSTADGPCSICTTNAFLNYEWLSVNCSRNFERVFFICESKDNKTSKEMNDSREMSHCNRQDTLVGKYCVHLLDKDRILEHDREPQVGLYSQEIITSILNHSNYLTAWTKEHVDDIRPGMSSIYVKMFGDNNNCLYTDDLFFAEVKMWVIQPCTIASSTVLFITPVNLVVDLRCTVAQFRCSDGTCILMENVCDGQADCPDASDEIMCISPEDDHQHNTGYNYYDMTFSCRHNTTVINLSKLCDGVADCSDNSDENILCLANLLHLEDPVVEYHPCRSGWSLCNINNTRCYPNSQICIHTKTFSGSSLYCKYTDHLKFCRQHQCPTEFKVRMQ